MPLTSVANPGVVASSKCPYTATITPLSLRAADRLAHRQLAQAAAMKAVSCSTRASISSTYKRNTPFASNPVQQHHFLGRWFTPCCFSGHIFSSSSGRSSSMQRCMHLRSVQVQPHALLSRHAKKPRISLVPLAAYAYAATKEEAAEVPQVGPGAALCTPLLCD